MSIAYATIDFPLPDTAAVIVAAMAGAIIFVRATITNTDSAPHTVTLYRTSTGATPDTSNIFVADTLSVPAGATLSLPLSGHMLIVGQALQAVADTAAVLNLSLSWMVST